MAPDVETIRTRDVEKTPSSDASTRQMTDVNEARGKQPPEKKETPDPQSVEKLGFPPVTVAQDKDAKEPPKQDKETLEKTADYLHHAEADFRRDPDRDP